MHGAEYLKRKNKNNNRDQRNYEIYIYIRMEETFNFVTVKGIVPWGLCFIYLSNIESELYLTAKKGSKKKKKRKKKQP